MKFSFPADEEHWLLLQQERREEIISGKCKHFVFLGIKMNSLLRQVQAYKLCDASGML
jgi:hypothetical protein